MNKNKYIFFNELINLAQSRLGSKIVYKTDEFLLLQKESSIPGHLYLMRECLINMVNGWMGGKQEEKEKRAMTI